MKDVRMPGLFALLLLLSLMLLACGTQPTAGAGDSLDASDPNAPVSSENPVPTEEPEPLPAGEVIEGEAMVDSIQLLILESFPVQVRVNVQGTLSDACTEVGTITQQREGNTFFVTIPTVRPADQMCAEMLQSFEESIALDVQGLPAGEYTVNVNGVTDTFTLAVDNELPSEEPVAEPGAEEPGSSATTACSTPGEGELLYEHPDFCLLYPAHFELLMPTEPMPPFVGTFRGPPLDESMEPLMVTLVMNAEPAPDGTLDDVVADRLDAYPDLSVERSEITVGGEPTVVLDGMPGLMTSRHLYTIHDGTLYTFILQPVGDDVPQAAEDAAALWHTVTESLTFKQ